MQTELKRLRSEKLTHTRGNRRWDTTWSSLIKTILGSFYILNVFTCLSLWYCILASSLRIPCHSVKWKNRTKIKYFLFLPKSTKEDCPTIFTCGAGMMWALVKVPSWENSEEEKKKKTQIMQFSKCSYILQLLNCKFLWRSWICQLLLNLMSQL